MSNKRKRKHKHHKNTHKGNHENKKFIAQKNQTLWQKIKISIINILLFLKNLFTKKKPQAKQPEKNNDIVIADPNFLDKVENIIVTSQSVTDLTTPLYNAYISDSDVSRISRLVNGQIPVNEANLDFQNLLVSEEVVEHLLKSNKVSSKVKEKVQEIKDKMDKKKQKLHAQPGFKSKPTNKPKPGT